MSIQIGKKVPEFVVFDEKGVGQTPRNYRGKWLLVYFYPKDDTPGCTKEACAIRDVWGDFKKGEIAVLGVSVQGVKSHQKFVEKYQLPFPLLVDEDHKMAEMFGVWREKKFMGRTYMGVERMSFLVDPKGKIAKIYEKVKPEVHASEILADVRELQKAG